MQHEQATLDAVVSTTTTTTTTTKTQDSYFYPVQRYQ
jgi:hypothetical protein